MQLWNYGICDKSSYTVKTLRWKIGEKIQGYGILQKELAELLCLNPSAIANYEGKRRLPEERVIRLMIDLAVKYSIFISREDFFSNS